MTSHEIIVKIKTGLETKQKQLQGELYDDTKTRNLSEFIRIQQGLKVCKKFIEYVDELMKEEDN